MATLADLFDELDNESSDEPLATNTTTISELIKYDLAQVIEFDRKNEDAIYANTNVLKNCLKATEDIVISAYNLREYVPNLSDTDSKQATFWKAAVIPNLSKMLDQDVKARSALIYAFGAVRDLGIVIQKASEIVFATKGSPKAIEIAKKNIPAALVKLNEHIEKAASLDSTAINSFSSSSAALFDIIGPKAGDFVKQKEDIEEQLDILYDRQDTIWSSYVKSSAKAKSFSYLIAATQKRLESQAVAAEATALRIAELNQLNKCTENKIQDIKESIDSVTTKSRKNFLFWRQNKETVVYETSSKEDQEKDKKYYESLIIARMERLSQEHKNADADEAKVKGLVDLLADYRSKYALTITKMENFSKNVNDRMDKNIKQINSLYDKLKKLEEEELAIEKQIGLTGKTLVECLINIQTYSKLIQKGAAAYSPLVSILNGIKSMVETDIELLSGSNTDIFIAGNRLTKLVGFISDYTVSSRPLLEVTKEYPSVIQQSITEN